jgi:hypothetical protein
MDIHSTSNANVCTTYTNYDFSKVSLMHPESLHGSSGTFFTKIGIGNVNEVLYIQTPKCITKQGVTTTAGKKAYIDLMFSNEDTSFIEFMENLEKSCIEKIHEKKNSWFTNEIDQADIENAFTSALRPFKGGKYYSMRANIAPSKNLMKVPTCFVFDETEKQLTIEDVKPENDIISVLEIQGIKFSQRSFQFEIIIRQVLIMANKPVFQSCLIKKHVGVGVGVEPLSVSITHVQEEVSEQEDSKNKDNKNNKNSKDVEDSLAVLHNPNHESVNTRDTTLFESHDTDKKVLLSPNMAPKPVSNVLSSLASSMLRKDETGENEENEENRESIDKQNTKLQPQKQNAKHKDSQENTENTENTENRKNTEITEITEITEVDLEIKDDEKIKIKKPNDIYYEIYKAAKEKARATRKLAFDAYLEVKKIKNTYMLDDSDSDTDYNSDSDSSSCSGSGSGSGSDTEND